MATLYSIKPYSVKWWRYPPTQATLKGTRLLSLGLKPQGFTARFDKLARAGYTYTELGVQHLPRKAGMATGARPSVIIRALREMFIYASKWHEEESGSSLG